MPGGTEAFRLYGSVGVDPKPAMQGLDQLSGHVQKSGGIIQNAMGTALGFLGGQYMSRAIDAGVGFIKGAAIDYNASMEQASIGFTTLLGSAQKAQSFIKDLQAFAAKTPFDFPGLQTAANQMLAMGFSSKEVIPMLTAVGDAVAALGGTPDQVNNAVRALGQMKQAGKVTAQDMMQLTSIGIPAWKLLADSMGISVGKARELSEKGLIPADKAIAAITTGIEKGNMGGMMGAQSKTFIGAMSNITDTVNQAAGKALQPFFEMVSTGAQQLATWMGSAEGAAFFQGISDAVSGLIGGLKTLLTAIAPVAKWFLNLASKAIPVVVDGISGLLTTLQPLIDAALSVGGAIMGVVDALTQGGTGTAAFGTAIGGLGDSIMGYINTWIATIPPMLLTLANQFVAWVTPLIPPLLAQLGTLAQSLLDWIIAEAPILAGQLITWAMALIDWIGPQIPIFLGKLLDFVDAGVQWLVSTGIPTFVKGLTTLASELVKWVGPQIPPLLGKLADLMVSVVSWIVTTGIPRLVGAAGKLGAGLIKGFVDLLTGTGGQPGLVASFVTFVTRDLVPGLIGMGGKLLDAAVKLGGKIIDGIVQALGRLPGQIADVIRDVFRNLNIDIGPFHISGRGITVDLPKIGFATGAWSVPFTGPAIVHQGEMIIPRDIAQRMRQGTIGSQGVPFSPATTPGGGGDQYFQVYIGTFYGTQANIDALSRSLAERARAARF